MNFYTLKALKHLKLKAFYFEQKIPVFISSKNTFQKIVPLLEKQIGIAKNKKQKWMNE